MAIALISASVVAVLVLALGVARWLSVRAIEEDLDDVEELVDDEEVVAEMAPGLPEGHRPPPGLGPISPSERFLAAEIERGLRDLQDHLLDSA